MCPHGECLPPPLETDDRLYSPERAPSDFYLFGKLRYLLTGKEFVSADEMRDELARFWRALAEMN
jgi:hypothetical protein